jgi:hypothetical protein
LLRSRQPLFAAISGEKTYGFAFSTHHVAPRFLLVMYSRDFRCGKWRMAHAATCLCDSAKAAIKVHKLRGNVGILEGSGGNIAVLTGSDGLSMLELPLPPAAAGGRQQPQRRYDQAPDQHPLALQSCRRQ